MSISTAPLVFAKDLPNPPADLPQVIRRDLPGDTSGKPRVVPWLGYKIARAVAAACVADGFGLD